MRVLPGGTCAQRSSTHLALAAWGIWKDRAERKYLRPLRQGDPAACEEGCENVITSGMMTSACVDWETPAALFNELKEQYNFSLDVCATADNAKCPLFYTPAQDGLSRDWAANICWMNPPYGRSIGKWVRKAFESASGGGNGGVSVASEDGYRVVARLLHARQGAISARANRVQAE